jgi:hypothetical protein
MKEATRLPEPLLDRQREFLGFLRSRLGTEEAARDQREFEKIAPKHLGDLAALLG